MSKQIIYILLLFSFICVSFYSCKKKHNINLNPDGTSQILNAEDDYQYLNDSTQTWHETDECICVLFGYGYNEQNFINSMKENLFKKYGDYANGGHILPLVFPDDFKRGSKAYITNLVNILEDKHVKGIILLGAPENTHKAIARLQDKYDGFLPYPVFSFFPQDDILEMEDASDFVLDKVQKAQINGLITEETQTFVSEVPMLLEKSVKYLLMSEGPFEKNSNLLDFVKMITQDLKIHRYSDSDTNLYSINHFVIE